MASSELPHRFARLSSRVPSSGFTEGWVRGSASAMRVFGLTGGIGTGKSTVARCWRQRGLGLVDADQLARDAVEPGSSGLDQLVKAFGAQILAGDGTLDRKR